MKKYGVGNVRVSKKVDGIYHCMMEVPGTPYAGTFLRGPEGTLYFHESDKNCTKEIVFEAVYHYKKVSKRSTKVQL